MLSKQRPTGSHASQQSISVAKCVVRDAVIAVAATKSLAAWLAVWPAIHGGHRSWLCERAAYTQQALRRHPQGIHVRHDVGS